MYSVAVVLVVFVVWMTLGVETGGDVASLSGACSLGRVNNARSLRSRARRDIAYSGSALSSL